jgi:hypothetical protein
MNFKLSNNVGYLDMCPHNWMVHIFFGSRGLRETFPSLNPTHKTYEYVKSEGLQGLTIVLLT